MIEEILKMPNPFVAYLESKILTEPRLLEPENAGLRQRIFDGFSPTNDQFGREAETFLAHAEVLYKNKIFKPPYTKNNVDQTHDIFMRMNKDLEESPEWNALWDKLKTEHSLSNEAVSLLKLQFLAAYRFKTISAFNTKLQIMYPSEKINIIAVEGGFLQNLNGLVKKDGEQRHLNSNELLNAVKEDLKKELNTAIQSKNNFSEFYSTKTSKLIAGLGLEGFKIVIDHFIKDNANLSPAYPGQLREFLGVLENESKTNNELREYIKTDPNAQKFFIKSQEMLKKINAPEDKVRLDFLENTIKSYPSNMVKNLKELSGKLEKGDFKDKVSRTINIIETMPNYPNLTFEVMSRILTDLKIAGAAAAFGSKKQDIIQQINNLCDLYKPKAAASPSPAVYAAMPTSKAPILFAASKASLVPSSSQIAQEFSPKDNLFKGLSEIANMLADEGVPEVSQLVRRSIDNLKEADNHDEIREIISTLKSDIERESMAMSQPLAAAASATPNNKLDTEQLIRDIDKVHDTFQSAARSKPKGP